MQAITVYKLFTVTPFPYLYMFLIGAFAYRYLNLFIYIVQKCRIVLNVGLLVFIYLGNRYVSVGEYVNILSGISLAWLTCVIAYAPGRRIRFPFDISYGIYLYHMIIVNVFVEFGMVGDMKYLVGAFFGSIICGFISWYGVEKRWLVRKKRKKRIAAN